MRRAVISGVGILCSIGSDRESFWKNLIAGTCGIRDVDLFDTSGYRTHTGAQLNDFKPEDHFSRRTLKRSSRCDRIGVVATREALADAQLDLVNENKERLAIIMGAGAAGMISAERYRRQQLLNEVRLPRPSLLVSFESSVLADYIALETGCRGPRATVVTACSSSATAIGYGLDLIKNDEADVVIAGGSESLCEMTYGGFNALRSVDPEPCKPFDLNRKGLSLGEGAGILILEERERAVNRNIKIYAEILSYALSSDAYHMTSPDPTGQGATNVMNWAIKRAGITIDDVDYISAHGTATKHNDVIECKAIHQVFGTRTKNLPVSSQKSMLGHCLGAAGSIEAVAVALVINRSIIPPTINYTTTDPAIDLDCVPNTSRPSTVRYALSNSFAFGGNNTSLLFGANNA